MSVLFMPAGLVLKVRILTRQYDTGIQRVMVAIDRWDVDSMCPRDTTCAPWAKSATAPLRVT